MIMSYEGYQEALESQKQKQDEITDLKKRQEIRIINSVFNRFGTT